jgi:MFS family permease
MYFRELRTKWRYLVAASVGLAFGATINLYLANTFAPHLLREFGWSKSQFALLGEAILAAMITLPIVGRLTDVIGVRRMVAIGVTLTPLVYVAFSEIQGNFLYFFFLNVLQIIVGAATTSLVYSRLIAENFSRARGLAFGIAACAAPAAGALATRTLSTFIDAHGWRAGYLAVAAATAVGGFAALLLIPKSTAVREVAGGGQKRQASRDYPEILASPAFRRIAMGMLLCNLTLMVQASQLKLILLDRGLAPLTATMMLSLYATGIILGRLVCGVALDRFPTHVVSALSLGLPCIGLFILGAGRLDSASIGVAVMTVGLSMGAELDVLAYLIVRFFKVELYSTVFGLVEPVISLSAALGSLLLSVTLKSSGGFNLFLYLAAASTLIGSAFFLMLGRISPAARTRTVTMVTPKIRSDIP